MLQVAGAFQVLLPFKPDENAMGTSVPLRVM